MVGATSMLGRCIAGGLQSLFLSVPCLLACVRHESGLGESEAQGNGGSFSPRG